MQRIGIYSGTFDPIHVGHIAFAKAAAAELSLDTIVFLPERQPRNKQNITDFHHRIALIRQAIQNEEKLRVIAVPSNQFTVATTLPEIRRHLPGAQLTLLIGSDIVHTFTYRWDGLDILIKEVKLAVGIREGDNQGELEAIFTQLEAQYDMPITRKYIATESAHLASSQLRAGKISPSQLPHPTMIKYIRDNRLYGA